jgi:CRISPR-associated exonuclease Cas4
MSRELTPDQEDPFLEIGRLISETAYKDERKEVRIENIVIDLLRRDGEDVVIGEVKKSSRYELSAKMQLAYYLLRLKRLGVIAKGELLFPKERKRIKLELTPELEEELEKALNEIEEIIKLEKPPEAKRNRFCSKCAYREFCWA